MRIPIIPVTLAFVSLILIPKSRAQSSKCVEFDCSSHGFKYAECSVPGMASNNALQSIQMVTKYSSSSCDRDRSYGYKSSGPFWVDHGCRAKFKVCYIIDINECESNPCQNGATCHDGDNRYTCSCAPGYSGTRCQTNVNECASSPCHNGATCRDGVNKYTCDCVPGYAGTRCETNINECESNPCQNGATCHDGDNRYTCSCAPGYSGSRCQTNVNECASSPCHNGATCRDGVNKYTCDCVSGYAGTRCETNINECESNPCQNGATCHDGDNRYTCSCTPGYSGTRCQTNVNECASSPCHNGATCRDGVNKYTCNCVPGYAGTRCETNINECESGPCQHGATCYDELNKYRCTCTPGYTGSNCQIDIDYCVGVTCQNGGTCVDGLLSYTCSCPASHTGDHCETDIDFCEGVTCENGGTCVDGTFTYTCVCPDSHTGRHCETDIDFCEGVTCQNGGSCEDGIFTFTCKCQEDGGFYGVYCESRDGGWTEWGNWSSCSTTCGDGLETSTRSCTNPTPLSDGLPCDGEGTKFQSCNIMACKWPLNTDKEFCINKTAGYYANTKDCTGYYVCRDDLDGSLLEYCDAGMNWDDNNKECKSGIPCMEDTEDETYGIDGWSEWSDWSSCSVSCGTGTMVSTRNCKSDTYCIGNSTQTVACNLYLCQDGECTDATCESWDYGHDSCNVTGMSPDSFIYNMRVKRRLSPAACMHEESFGFNERKDIWVDYGCRAEFTVCYIKEYDDCNSSPCENEGVCTDEIASYSCNCTADFVGVNCEIERDSCTDVVCQNGGTCHVNEEDPEQFTCECTTDFTGTYCDLAEFRYGMGALVRANIVAVLVAVILTFI